MPFVNQRWLGGMLTNFSTVFKRLQRLKELELLEQGGANYGQRTKKEALVVPSNAVVDLGGRRGVFQPQNGTAVFRVVQVGLEQPDMIEVLGGLAENESVITTGASALRDG